MLEAVEEEVVHRKAKSKTIHRQAYVYNKIMNGIKNAILREREVKKFKCFEDDNEYDEKMDALLRLIEEARKERVIEVRPVRY